MYPAAKSLHKPQEQQRGLMDNKWATGCARDALNVYPKDAARNWKRLLEREGIPNQIHGYKNNRICQIYIHISYACIYIWHIRYIQMYLTHPCDKWVPVTTVWRVLNLRMEERPPIWRVAINILNKQSRTADKGWSSSLGVGEVLTSPPCENPC